MIIHAEQKENSEYRMTYIESEYILQHSRSITSREQKDHRFMIFILPGQHRVFQLVTDDIVTLTFYL